MEFEGDDDISFVIATLGTIPKSLVRELEEFEVGGRTKTIQTTFFAEYSQNTEKTPGDLKKLVVTQTPVKDHQQNLF